MKQKFFDLIINTNGQKLYEFTERINIKFLYFSKNFQNHIKKITKIGGIILLLTGIAILTGQLQILGFFILEYFPSLNNIVTATAYMLFLVPCK